jgi:Uri superfamily endonuclease
LPVPGGSRMDGGCGTYVLVFELLHGVETPQGTFQGRYCYVGSAFGPGGLSPRIGRHLRRSKALRWHIDHLTSSQHFRPLGVFASPERAECRTALALTSVLQGHAGFGSSDCSCPSHLFCLGKRSTEFLASVLREMGFCEFEIAPGG